MKIPANSLYFKLNGPDQTLARSRPTRSGQRVNSGATKSTASNKPRLKCRPKPFQLTGEDSNLLWGQIGLSHGVLKGRGYFSVPSTVEGALWLLNRGFTQDQIELGPFIGAPMLRADEDALGNQAGDQEPMDYVLIPTSKVLDSRGEQIREVLPHRTRAKAAFDIHPICRRYLVDHQPLIWTNTLANADSAVSRWGAAIALHGTYPGGVVPTVEELERLYLDSNLDKLLLEHVFVIDSDEPHTGAFYQTLERLAQVLPDVQVAPLRTGSDGGPTTLASLCVQENYELDVYEWEEES